MAGQVKPIPVPVILAAVSGDENALAAVVAHYQKYIRALATRPVKDEYSQLQDLLQVVQEQKAACQRPGKLGHLPGCPRTHH